METPQDPGIFFPKDVKPNLPLHLEGIFIIFLKKDCCSVGIPYINICSLLCYIVIAYGKLADKWCCCWTGLDQMNFRSNHCMCVVLPSKKWKLGLTAGWWFWRNAHIEPIQKAIFHMHLLYSVWINTTIAMFLFPLSHLTLAMFISSYATFEDPQDECHFLIGLCSVSNVGIICIVTLKLVSLGCFKQFQDFSAIRK